MPPFYLPDTPGGDLIDAFNIGGQYAVEELIREQFGVFMYKGGKGQSINRAEYLRWKYMENAEVSIPIEASLSSHDPLGKWQDHKACWYVPHRCLRSSSILTPFFNLSVGRCSTGAHWARACCTFSSFVIRKFTPSEKRKANCSTFDDLGQGERKKRKSASSKFFLLIFV